MELVALGVEPVVVPEVEGWCAVVEVRTALEGVSHGEVGLGGHGGRGGLDTRGETATGKRMMIRLAGGTGMDDGAVGKSRW